MWYNKIMIGILRSPLHSMISGGIMIIGFTGSKSGKKFSTPVNFLEIEDKLYVMTDRTRVWWKNIKKNPGLELHIKRENLKGSGLVIDSKTEVEKYLALIYKHHPQMAKYMKVKMSDGQPVLEDIQKLSDQTIVIEITKTA